MEIGMRTSETESVAKPFHCTICPKTFVYELSLEEHILNKHVAEKKFQCAECFETKQLTKSFATQIILTKHIKRAHGPPRFKCQVCFKTFTDSSNFTSHKRRHFQENIKRYKCVFCSKAFHSNQDLQTHLFYVHKQKREDVSYFKCEICFREFCKRADLERHVVHQHVVDKAFECPVCSKTFIDQDTLEKHRKRHDRHNEYFCDICFQGFTLKTILVNHLGVKHNHFFYCNKCFKSFKNKIYFDEHISDSEQELKCCICQQIINSECNLKIHTDSHVMEIKTETKDNEIEKPMKPSELDKNFTPKSTKDLKSDDNLRCQLCSKTFDCEDHFADHRRVAHRNAKWECDFKQCSKSYRWYNQLKLHKMMHAETKQFICDICQKAFYRPDSLKDHQQVHVKEKKHKCKICPKSFIAPSALRTHIANNHGGIKPFKCPVLNCGTLWARMCELEMHLISHQSCKPFKCEQCPIFKAFKSLRQLKVHQHRVHSVAKVNKALKAQENLKNKKHSDAVIFIYSEDACSFKADDGTDVALHYNEQH